MATDSMTYEDLPAESRGMLAHNPGHTSLCMSCGWRGVPTIVDGEPVHECPACQTGPEVDREYETARPSVERRRRAVPDAILIAPPRPVAKV